MQDAYDRIQQRVAGAEAKKPSPLRQTLTELFINHPAVAPHDQCTPATDKMIRYKLANGISLGHQVDVTLQHVWLAADRLPAAYHSGAKFYSATAGGKGRHSNVNQMPDLRDRAVARLTISDISQAETLLNDLLAPV